MSDPWDPFRQAVRAGGFSMEQQRRIIACVAALDGIDTKIVEAYAEEIAALVRRELLPKICAECINEESVHPLPRLVSGPQHITFIEKDGRDWHPFTTRAAAIEERAEEG